MTGINDDDLLSDGARRRLDVVRLRLGVRIARVHEQGDDAGAGDDFAQQLQALRLQCRGQNADPRRVSAGPVHAGHEAQFDRIAPGSEDDRDGCSRRLGRPRRRSAAGGSDHSHPMADQLGRQCRQSIVLAIGRAVLNRNVLALNIARLFQSFAEPCDEICGFCGRPGAEEPDHRHRGLLGPRRERPRCATPPSSVMNSRRFIRSPRRRGRAATAALRGPAPWRS